MRCAACLPTCAPHTHVLWRPAPLPCPPQARSSIRSSIQAVAEQYKCVDAVSGVTAAQLDALRSELLTHESSKPAPESPLPPGPDEVRGADMHRRQPGLIWGTVRR